MYTKNELMFPHYAIQHLRDARGDEWCKLIDHVASLPETHEEVLAFMLMMIRINGCLPCETDSYRAMRGCIMCTRQTLRRFKESDDELLHLYAEALGDVRAYKTEQRVPTLLVSLPVRSLYVDR
jgi:hypothetical protein